MIRQLICPNFDKCRASNKIFRCTHLKPHRSEGNFTCGVDGDRTKLCRKCVPVKSLPLKQQIRLGLDQL